MNLPLLYRTVLASFLLGLASVSAQTLPSGGVVAAGHATISSSGSTLSVNQTSTRAIINWGSFSIGPGGTAAFNLPSANSAVLNRVTGTQLSSLMGTLASNGQVYLLNPNGIVIGPHGKVRTGGFVASTLGLSDEQFLKGGAQTFRGDSTAEVVVLGTVKAATGDVLLVAAQVNNKGKLIARDGHVVLSAGSEVLYTPGGDSNIAIAAPAPATGAAINNDGIIKAASVQLAAAGSAYALAVNNGGQISATAVRQVGGHVILDGGAGDVVTSGSVTTSAGANGGTVSVTGGRVAVTEGATVSANAAENGDGGTIFIEGTTATNFAGTITALGGHQGGNGGQAEISGGALGFSGAVDLTAAKGQTGSLLLDPDQITVVAGNLPPPQSASSGTWAFADDPGAQTITNGAITSLLATGNVTLQATNSITVNAAISSAAAHLLEFDSPTVNLNAAISLSSGFLAFNGTTTGPVQQGGPPPLVIGQSLSSTASATLSAATINLQGYNQFNLAGAVQTPFLQLNQRGLAANSVTATNSGNQITTMILGPDGSGGLDSYSGPFAVSSSGNMTVEGKATVNGGMSATSNGNFALSAADVTQGTQFSSSGAAITLGSSSGAFMNNVGTTLFSGTGRRIIYSSTNAGGYTDGGLGYSTFNPVVFGQDPDSGVTNVIYLASAPSLPTLTITANSFSRNYGQPDPTFTASYAGGAATDLTTAVQFGIQGGTDVYPGVYTINPFGAISSTHQLSYVNGALTVNKAPLLITANDASRFYGGANPAFSASFGGLVNGDTDGAVLGLAFGTTATPASGVGGYAIVPSGGSALYYNISYASGTLTVQPAPLLITPNLSRAYGAPLASTLPALDFSGFVNGESQAVISSQPALATSATAATGVGNYAITASGATAPNYSISYAPGTLTITPAPLFVTASDATRTYGAANPSFGYTVSGLLNGDSSSVLSGVAFSTSASATSAVGTYAVVPSGGSAANYSPVFANGTLMITPAPLLITPNLSLVYGGALPGQLPLSDFTGFVNGDTPSSLAAQPILNSTRTEASGVGAYPSTASGAAADNYTLSYAPGTVTVTPALLRVTANNATRLYGSPNPAFTDSVSGLVNGDTAAVISGLLIKTAATPASNVGSYALVPSGASAANYTISYASGTLSVTPAPLLLIPAGSMSYGSAPADAAISFTSSGFLNGDTLAALTTLPTFSTNATSASNAGSYSLVAAGGTAPNYTIQYQPGVMSVTQAILTLVPAPLTAVYGSTGPAPSAGTFVTSGLQNGDTLAKVFLSPPTVSFPSAAGLSAGTYLTTINTGPVVGLNYIVTTLNGTLTVTPAPLTITPDLTLVAGGPLPTVLPTKDFSGFVNGDTAASLTKQPSLEFSFPIGTGVNAFGAVDPNYTFSYQRGSILLVTTLTETLKPTTITPDELPVKTEITVNPNYTAPFVYGKVLGGLGAEAGNIIAAFLEVAKSKPPQTQADIIAALNNPATSAAMLGALQPFIYADLSNILDAPQSSWTDSQAFFVQQMMDYVQAQRRSAALQAEADYETWATAQVAQENAQINAVSGPAQVYLMAALSANPPVPPTTFLQEVQAGMTMTVGQAATAVQITQQTANIGGAIDNAGNTLVIGGAQYLFENEGAGTGNDIGTELGKVGKKIFPNAANTIKSLEQDAATGDQVAIAMLKQGTKVGAAVAEVAGAAGAVFEVIGTIVQIGMGADAYAKQSQYNAAFQQAVQTANKPVTISDLKSMLSGSSPALMGYMTAFLATGPAGKFDASTGLVQTFNASKPTQSLSAILSITSHI